MTYHWSAQDMSTVDGLPYIGRYNPFTRHVWVATGFGAWGMTNGTLAGLGGDGRLAWRPAGRGAPCRGRLAPVDL